VGVHERHIETGGIVYRVGGMAEVCVHPDYRGRGYVRTMLRRIHAWLPGEGFVFSVLFGDAAIYASSGYVQVANLSYGGAGEWKQAMAMVRELAHIPWPAGEVHLPGKKF
jgi:predicted N-acetyltransferase YhbS